MLIAVHGLGFVFEKFRQPKLLGEILAGVLLGPFVLGPHLPTIGASSQTILSFLSQAGLLLLMFLAGTEARQLNFRQNSRFILWLLVVGTGLPFALILLGADWIPLEGLIGTADSRVATLIVLGIAVSVTSIPVLSRIFQELNILHTRFAGLVLGTAVLEDILLWGVLAFAQVLATSKNSLTEIVLHTGINLGFMMLGLLVLPRLLARLPQARVNFISRTSPAAWPLLVLLVYVSLGHLLGVNVVFAAFLAGFGVIGGAEAPSRTYLGPSLEAIGTVARAFFIPLFFAMVGHKLILGRGFDLSQLVLFLLGSSLLSCLGTALAAWCAGFRRLDIVNVALTNNARGGPGIVLAGIAFESQLINATFYTTLVITAILTSQMAGLWLKYVLAQGWPLWSQFSNEHR
jgi:Kef-type K+ transport system membrane component KefB